MVTTQLYIENWLLVIGNLLRMDIYQEIILDHYKNPRNYGTLNDASAQTLDNPSCGDSISMSVRIAEGRVADIAFTGSGCAISQASASILTEHVKGKTLQEVDALDKDAILKLLGIELSPARLKCALLGLQTLQKLLDKKNSSKK